MTGSPDNTLVEFHNVAFSLAGPSSPIISNLNLTVNRGETLVLLGESGCGKTTTLKLVNRLLLPTAGEVLVEGKPTTAWDPIMLRSEKRIEDRVAELLQIVGLDRDKFASRYPRELSGGQRQRVGVARALAADPSLLLLDEPFGALDPLTRASLQREFGSLAKRLGKTAIFVTHDVREALLLASRIGLMHAGKLLLLESPERFLASDNPHARAYVDSLELVNKPDKAAGDNR